MGETARVVGSRERLSGPGVAGLLLALVAFPLYKIQLIDRFVRTSDQFWTWSGMYVGAELVIAVLCVASVVREGGEVRDIGLRLPTSKVWWTVLTVVLVVAGVIIALRHSGTISIVGREGQDYGALAAQTTANRVLIVLSSAVVVPIEELIWRGFSVTRLQRLHAPTGLAVLLPSLAFGYFHGGTIDTLWISVFITISVTGLCVVYLRTQSLAWPIVIHFGWNALLISVTPTPP